MNVNRSEQIIGIDVGGANLKLATWRDSAEPECIWQTFPLWKHPDELGRACKRLIDRLGEADRLAVTMTGELADCFATRREGVAQILDQLSTAVPPDRISVYAVDGRWRTPSEAIADPWQVAASNWHALASWLGRWPDTAELCRRALLVDIGSTTVDIIPLVRGQVSTRACTDRQRLEHGQLVYTGIARTPVCAVTQHLKLGNIDVPLMAELFATTDDAYLVLGYVAEDPSDRATADGRPRTIDCAAARLARMIGEDSQSLAQDDVRILAEQIVIIQAQQVARAIERNLTSLGAHQARSRGETVHLLFTGHGRPLFERAIDFVRIPHEEFALTAAFSVEASRCAPAVAVAWLLMTN